MSMLGIPKQIADQAAAQEMKLPVAPIQPAASAKPEIKQQQIPQKALAEPTSAQQLADLFRSPEDKRRERDLAIKEERLALQKEAAKESKMTEAFKLTKDERKVINDNAKGAKRNLRDLERLEELQNEGDLSTPGYVEFLQRSGLDIPSLMNPGSEEFQKIAQTFMRDARVYTGGRVTNYEMEQFLKTIPSLSQSPEGRKRIISNLKYLNRAAVAYSDTLKDIISENNGVPPLDLSERIDDKIDSKLDAIAKRFKEDIKKPVPAAQNKLVTALGAILGSAIGAPGKLLSGIGGALSGPAAIPPIP
jgi:hypothetical protein